MKEKPLKDFDNHPWYLKGSIHFWFRGQYLSGKYFVARVAWHDNSFSFVYYFHIKYAGFLQYKNVSRGDTLFLWLE